MKILIDTNVILDALMNRAPWAKAAQGVMLAIAEEKAVGCITASTFTDIYYLLRKHLNDRERTKRTLRGLLSVISVLDVNGKDCEEAFELPMPDYEDALLAHCAKRHMIDKIITRNVKHFDGSPVKVIRPEDFVA
jgi:predicted nucleic acid-binding protein